MYSTKNYSVQSDVYFVVCSIVPDRTNGTVQHNKVKQSQTNTFVMCSNIPDITIGIRRAARRAARTDESPLPSSR